MRQNVRNCYDNNDESLAQSVAGLSFNFTSLILIRFI